jgi:hypothetical protein
MVEHLLVLCWLHRCCSWLTDSAFLLFAYHFFLPENHRLVIAYTKPIPAKPTGIKTYGEVRKRNGEVTTFATDLAPPKIDENTLPTLLTTEPAALKRLVATDLTGESTPETTPPNPAPPPPRAERNKNAIDNFFLIL